MNSKIKDIIANRVMSLESVGIPSNIAYVSVLETMVDSLAEVVSKRETRIRTLESVVKELGDKLVDAIESNSGMVDAYESEISQMNSGVYYRCSEYDCGFPHEWKAQGHAGDRYCPQCGNLGDWFIKD